jgi:dTDP-4-dehydrorhamnose reductase
VQQEQQQPSRVAIVGAAGRLGAALARVYAADHEVRAFTRAQIDLAAPAELHDSLGDIELDVLINCAAQTNVDRCETHREEAFTINGEAPGVLAEICAAKGARLIHISTDYVFDGEKQEAYREEDAPNPISVYGESKLEGERRVLAAGPQHLVARVSWVFGPDRASFVDWIVDRAREQEHVEAVADKFSSPTYTVDIAEMLRAFVTEHIETGGLIHLANTGRCSWREYGQWALDCCAAEGVALRARSVGAITLADMKNFIARRPVHTVMATARYEQITGRTPRTWQEAVADYVRDHVAPRAQV